PQNPAQARDVGLDGVAGGRWGCVAPQVIDQPGGGNDASRVQDQVGEQRPLPRPAKREAASVLGGLDRPEQAELKATAPHHGCTLALAAGPRPVAIAIGKRVCDLRCEQTASVLRSASRTLLPGPVTGGDEGDRTETRMNCHGTGGQGRWLGRLTARLAGLAVVLPVAACSQGAATVVHTASTAKLTVTSTLDRLTALPHRIHWQAFPGALAADVSEVDYLIDGKQLWTEHNAPYFYGSDGNYLVTWFLMPGRHTFTVRAVTAGGQTATDT